jgi:SOS-response transcriptional repressor LexA
MLASTIEPPDKRAYILVNKQTSLQGHKHAYKFICMNLSDRIKQARKHAGLTQRELAAAAKVEQPLISQLETGKTLKTAYIAQLAKACGVDPLWLSSGSSKVDMVLDDGTTVTHIEMKDRPRYENIGTVGRSSTNVMEARQPYRIEKGYPLISWVAAGTWQESCDNFHPGDADERIKSDQKAGDHGYWLEVSGPSMKPVFEPGTRILVQPEGYDLISGKFYIAKLADTGETTFKQYLRDGGTSFLQPLNPAFPIIPVLGNVTIIGRVIDFKPPPGLL